MRNLFLLIPVIMFFSCSGSDEREVSDHNKKEKEQPAQMMNMAAADSVLTSYISIRKNELAADQEVDVSGNIVYDKDGLWIINIEEQWDMQSYFVSLVIGASNQVKGAGEMSDGVESDMADFVNAHSDGNVLVFQGNFLETDLKIPGEIPLVLDQVSWFRTNCEGNQILYLIREKTRLERTALVAHNLYIAGECEEIAGYKETFKTGDLAGEVYIIREENHLEDCKKVLGIKYQKFWTRTEQMLTESLPRYFYMDYTGKSFYDQMPRKFFQLAVSGKDTLIDAECYFEIVDHSYSEQSIFAALREIHFNDMAESLIIDLTKDPSGGAFKIICRNSGMLYNGGDYNLVSDQLDRAEQDMEYSTLIFRPLENDKELFYLTRAGVETVWTTSQDKYKNVELEDEY